MDSVKKIQAGNAFINFVTRAGADMAINAVQEKVRLFILSLDDDLEHILQCFKDLGLTFMTVVRLLFMGY